MEHFKHNLTGYTSRRMEERGTKSDVNCGGLVQEVSEMKNFNILNSDPSCDILVKNVAAFALVRRVC